MSTMKKVISLLLCVAMLFGTVAVVGSVASAEELSGAPLEGTNIETYADLVAQYGTKTGEDGLTDGFIYYGAEVVESNGKITDGYVKPGDVLDVRLYVKSNMYTGDGVMFLVFDNDFFDIKLPAGATNALDSEGYTMNCETGLYNANHPMIKQNTSIHKLTAIPMTRANNLIKKQCGFTDEYLSSHDFIKSQTITDINNKNAKPYQMTADEYLISYKVTVKSGLKDGDTGVIDSPESLWQSGVLANGLHDGKKEGYFPTRHITTTDVTISNIAGKMSLQMDSGALDHFIIDAKHTLTIGEPEAATKYTAKFIAEDTVTEIDKDEYEVGENVEFPAAVENQIGWAITREGNTNPGTILKPAEDGTYTYTVKEADVDFLRVLSTDKFPVKISLGAQLFGKEYDVKVDTSKLEGTGIEFLEDEMAFQIMLPIGGSFDLASIPEGAVTKAGNEITGWDTSTVTGDSTLEGTVLTLNAVNGVLETDITVSSKALWSPAEYTVKYYLNKESVGKEPLKTTEGVKHNDLITYNGVDAETGKTYDIASEIPDKKFAGWYRVDTDELVTTATNIGQYTFGKDMEFYAKWTDYANSVTFMVRDYATGKWVANKPIIFRGEVPEGGQATLASNDVKNAIAAACKDENTSFMYLYTTNPDEIKDGNYKDYQVAGVLQVQPGVYAAPDIKYTGNVVYYIASTLAYEVTWKIPAYDEATNTFDEAKATVAATDKVSTAVHAGAGNPYAASSKLTQIPEAPVGYALAGWKNAETGEVVTLNENGAYVVTGTEKATTLIATYELVEYSIAFNLQNSNSPDIVMLEGTVTLGGEIEIKDAKFTFNGEESVLPEIGLANDKQPAGGYTLPEGYKFAGWTFGTGTGATKVEFPVKLTADIIKRYYANGVININAAWEAQEYKLSFYITNAAGEEELFAEYKVKAGDDISKYRTTTPEIIEAINAKAPEGKVFSNIWLNKETNALDTTLTKMPAKDVVYIASYSTAKVRVYLDVNNLPEKDLNKTMSIFRIGGNEILEYNADTSLVIEAEPYYNRSFQTVVMRSISNTETAAIIGWNIYHIGAGEDPLTAEWKPGINDEDTAIAKTPIIFQAVWLEHKDMLFRVYDTDGKLAHALGKDLSTHFWNNGEIVSSASETAINRNTELYLAYILTMSIENWNWDEFFNIEMWQSLTVSFNPFPIPKSWFTWEGFKGLLDAIGNALGSLL